MPLFAPRPRRSWRTRSRMLELGERTLLMGIVNCTPDSFSDGGEHVTAESAIRHSLRLLDEGADILDLGAESTRPGATPVTAELEQERLLPVLTQLRRLRPDALLSVDTYHAATATQALLQGADIINDVSGLLWDPAMPAALAAAPSPPGVVLMHARGTPQSWHSLPPLAADAVLPLVQRELLERMAAAPLPRESLVLDPGFGFGKLGAENFALLAGLADLHALGRPLLVGLSRKGFLAAAPGAATDKSKAALSPERQHSTSAAHTASILAGAHILRVHDVAAARAVASVADRLLAAGAP